jgi:hypothetical protein
METVKLFKIRDHHVEVFGYEEPVTYAKILQEVRDRSFEDRHKISCLINPFNVRNVNFVNLHAQAFRYPGGFSGDIFKRLVLSIHEKGIIKPPIGYYIHEGHPFWKKGGKKRPYLPDSYTVKEGVHRVCACQVLHKKIPLIVLEAAN